MTLYLPQSVNGDQAAMTLIVAGSAVFWVLGASFFFVVLHAAFYNFDALDVDSDTQELTGSIVEEV